MSTLSVLLPAPTGVFARYVGNSGGSTTRYYWVQAIYPDGFSQLGQSQALANTLANLDHNNQVYVEWSPMAGAIGYLVFYTTTSTAPTQGTILIATTTAPNFTDQGQSNSPFTGTVVGSGGFNTARAQYNFANDGGAVSTITVSLSDIIPAGSVLLGGFANPTVALTSGGSATISIGVTAGLSSPTTALKAATAVASYSIDALLSLIPTFASPLKTTAAGTVTITVAVAALTAGVMEITVFYFDAINL
jgi:hypothetical protein